MDLVCVVSISDIVRKYSDVTNHAFLLNLMRDVNLFNAQ